MWYAACLTTFSVHSFSFQLSPTALTAKILSPKALETRILNPDALAVTVLSPCKRCVHDVYPCKFLAFGVHRFGSGTRGTVVVLSPSVLTMSVCSKDDLMVEAGRRLLYSGIASRLGAVAFLFRYQADRRAQCIWNASTGLVFQWRLNNLCVATVYAVRSISGNAGLFPDNCLIVH